MQRLRALKTKCKFLEKVGLVAIVLMIYLAVKFVILEEVYNPISADRCPTQVKSINKTLMIASNAQKSPLQPLHLHLQNSSSTSSSPSSSPSSSTSSSLQKKIYFYLIGRLGNCIMEFASMYGLSRTTGAGMYFVDGHETKELKLLFPRLNAHLKLVKNMPFGLTKASELMPNIFCSNLSAQIAVSPSDVMIAGYLGSWKYWWPQYEKDLRKVLVLEKKLVELARKYLLQLALPHYGKSVVESRQSNINIGPAGKVSSNQLTFVGIQVRRGDKSILQSGWQLPTVTYFQKAIRHFRKLYQNVLFVVVSEDKSWAQENIKGDKIAYSKAEDDMLELTLLALCDHMIMSAGTYSWWAAWLSGGQVVYYKDHYKPRSEISTYFEDEDYFLPHWMPMKD